MIQGKSVKMIQKIALVIGVLMIPLMYSYFYLNAFWDPYQRLDKVPVAVVNLDEGAVINDEERNLGDEITDKLKEEKELGFDFTTAEKAKEGVLKDKYYASITIPKDFSSDAATVGEDTEKLHGKIIYSANQKKNYLAAQILENAMPKIKEEVNSKIDKQIVGTISAKVRDVPKQLGKLDDGLLKLDNGAVKLKDGTVKLSKGANVLAEGLAKLNGNVPVLTKGAGKLNDGAAKLSKGMKILKRNNKTLNNGAGKVAKGAGSLKKGVGAYTKGVDQAKDGAAALKKGVDQYTGGVDQLAAGAEKLDAGLAKIKGGVDRMDSEVSAAKSKLDQDASDANLKAIDDGAAQVSGGLSRLDEGFDVDSLMTAINGYKAGQVSEKQIRGTLQSVKDNISTLNTRAPDLKNGVNSLTSGMKGVKSNIAELQGEDGLGQLEAGLGDSKTPGETVMYGSAQINGGLGQLKGNSSALKSGAAQLGAGLDTISSNSDKLNDGAAQLAEGSKTLKGGVSKYTKGVGDAQKGTGKLADGTNQLTGKLPELAEGVGQLDNGGSQLAAGAGTLDSGAGKLSAGIHTASSEVSTSVGKANSQVAVLDGLPEYAAKPVDTKTEYVQGVKNYGSAFAPYFMGLSLWVGGLLIFFGLYFDYNRRIKLLTRDSRRFIMRSFAFALVSIGQGVLLAFVIKYALHITVNNMAMFYLGCILTALSFTAVIQFCIINLGDIGKFLVMLLLILQLTSCAGTFPIETQNAFFRVINPFLPMTYSTQLFKEAISGTIGSNFWYSAAILLAFAVGFLTLTNIFSYKKIKDDIHEMKNGIKDPNPSANA